MHCSFFSSVELEVPVVLLQDGWLIRVSEGDTVGKFNFLAVVCQQVVMMSAQLCLMLGSGFHCSTFREFIQR